MLGIKGLQYHLDFINQKHHDQLINIIDNQNWDRSNTGRGVQQYGYAYNFRARKVGKDMYIGPLPDWLQTIAQDLVDKKIMPKIATQVILNEYHPGEGIAMHVDCIPCFGDVICSLSLGGAVVMDLTHKYDPNKRIHLQPSSLLVLKGPARYSWRHGIKKRHHDIVNGIEYERERRVSLTFRTVIL